MLDPSVQSLKGYTEKIESVVLYENSKDPILSLILLDVLLLQLKPVCAKWFASISTLDLVRFHSLTVAIETNCNYVHASVTIREEGIETVASDLLGKFDFALEPEIPFH